jgi:hypothetical protein
MGDENELHAPADRQRFLEALPWYVNGTLDADERRWVEGVLGCSPWARGEHAFELEIARATRAQLDEVAAMPLADLLGRVRAARAPVASPSGRPLRPWLDALAAALRTSILWVARPGFAMGLLAVVVLQTATLGWLALRGAEDAEATRSWGAGQAAASIRVSAAPGVSEAQIRRALLSAGVTIGHGPNELGEYLVRPSGVKSFDEALAALRAAPAFAAVEVVR